MGKRKSLVIPNIPYPPPIPPKKKADDNPFDKLKKEWEDIEPGEIKVHKEKTIEPTSYEYDVVPVQLGMDLPAFIRFTKGILLSKAAEGWRYKNSIRKNTSEEVLIFERGIYG
jgi:hypothetical protein